MDECYENLLAKGVLMRSNRPYTSTSSFPIFLQQYLPVAYAMFICFSSKGYKFESPVEPPPADVDDAMRRQEEEDLQRVIEMSKSDKGGRSHWVDHSSMNVGASSSAGPSTSPTAHPPGSSTNKYPSGYTPAASPALSTQAQPSPRTSSATTNRPATQPTILADTATVVPRTQPVSVPFSAQAAAANPAPPEERSSTAAQPAVAASVKAPPSTQPSVPKPASRVRALHKFEPTEPGELGFEKGDVIKVVDRGYKDWWRGQLRGKTGIFPVNYVVSVCDSPTWMHIG
jgi:signal transducing adaptor molecule